MTTTATHDEFNLSSQATHTELNAAQATIYTRTNISRAFPDFDDSGVVGIYLRGDSCLVVYRDGTERLYPKDAIKTTFISYTHRLKDFFSYLGPNYRGPSIWHDNSYILFKGWNYSHTLGHLNDNAKLQGQWADKFIRLTDPTKLKALLQSEHTDLGHLVAPDGLRLPDRLPDLDSELETVQEERPMFGEPNCSCGSFQRQLNNLPLFQQEIEGFKPHCIHLTWIAKYRSLLSKRTEARDACPAGVPHTCVAWWYQPPMDHASDGRFLLLHTKSGVQAPLSHWRTYKPKESFTQRHAWDLFFSMLDAGYVPFPGTSLPQLRMAFKHD